MASVTEVGSNMTSYRRVFDEVIDAVATVIDPSIAGPSAGIPVDEAPIGARVGLMFTTKKTAGQKVPG